jgi:hypothetical protein
MTALMGRSHRILPTGSAERHRPSARSFSQSPQTLACHGPLRTGREHTARHPGHLEQNFIGWREPKRNGFDVAADKTLTAHAEPPMLNAHVGRRCFWRNANRSRDLRHARERVPSRQKLIPVGAATPANIWVDTVEKTYWPARCGVDGACHCGRSQPQDRLHAGPRVSHPPALRRRKIGGAEQLLGLRCPDARKFGLNRRFLPCDARADVGRHLLRLRGSRACALDVLADDRAAHANVIKPLGEGAPPQE